VALTGRFSFRKTFTGKCVLQLEEDVRAWWPRKRMKRRWRDANLMDLACSSQHLIGQTVSLG
jgi:hypothetical protein